MTREDSTKASGLDRHFILVGGFLGAGKTTSIALLVRYLQNQGLRCGIISNDQGSHLIDSQLAAASSDATEEITGGCFCCRLDELSEALTRLDQRQRPDVFIAEPVGSCTDLAATVLLPLQTFYQSPLKTAPLSVLMDARRALNVFAPKPEAKSFHKDVNYIYLKQVEEAEILVVNKSELLSDNERAALADSLQSKFPDKILHFVSASTGEGMEDWFKQLEVQPSTPAAIQEIDYDRYGKGEAMLGWYNANIALPEVSNAEKLLLKLAQEISDRLEKAEVEVAHFKMSLHIENELAVVNQTASGQKPRLSKGLSTQAQSGFGDLTVNLRAEGPPKQLTAAVRETFAAQSEPLEEVWRHEEAFQPGQPNPTHRVEALS